MFLRGKNVLHEKMFLKHKNVLNCIFYTYIMGRWVNQRKRFIWIHTVYSTKKILNAKKIFKKILQDFLKKNWEKKNFNIIFSPRNIYFVYCKLWSKYAPGTPLFSDVLHLFLSLLFISIPHVKFLFIINTVYTC